MLLCVVTHSSYLNSSSAAIASFAVHPEICLLLQFNNSEPLELGNLSDFESSADWCTISM